jgi:hypothetical protein
MDDMVVSSSDPAAHWKGSREGVSGLVSPHVIFCSATHITRWGRVPGVLLVLR